ncbi:MAG: GNAT family N-acetyltransferase [Clostridiaceae bacterium]|jgi:[citrate (pro-3S)-lyase] ligase|nr:GNAT family N-acetyltransferase [Clostridiaceae bacterium]
MQVYSNLIDPKDADQVESQLHLLQEAGIRLDPLVDWSLALYADNKMLATGSCFRYTLRSIAVAVEHQGSGLMAQLITGLEKEAARRSLERLMLVSQPKDRELFSAVGFTGLAESRRGVTLMENSAAHFPDFLKKLQAEFSRLPSTGSRPPQRAAIVMNANPFTKGHRFLVESALKECDQLLLLVLSDDPQQGFTFEQRFDMVRRGCADLPQVLTAASGPYAVSTASFPSYFYPPSELDEKSAYLNDETELDAALFARIAEYLGISKRFVGSEPLSPISNFYNQVLSRELADFGIELCLVERLCQEGEVVSASRVRDFLKNNNFSAAEKLLPATSRAYLKHLGRDDTRSQSEN